MLCNQHNKLIKFLISIFGVLILSYACADDSVQQDEFKQQASATIKQLATNLKKELSNSMQAGGPVAAVKTCNIKAPEITEALNNKITIKRTSLRLRNPNNAPDAWERQVLNSFEKKLAEGTPADQLIHIEKLNTNAGSTFRMMKAIPTQGICLTCHGDKQTMSEDLLSTLQQTYPNDLATDYQVGQIRGAFSVTQTIDN